MIRNLKHTFSHIAAIALCLCTFSAMAQEVVTDSSSVSLGEVVVMQRQGMLKPRYQASNSQIITSAELKRAACCNLGESFTTNPSVDVSYNDAATGARQIKLLGLAGTYVQMLTENVPNFRLAAAPYGLGYVAGPWMQSIQVSKGASSVKNGYESITGQINIEMKKPQADEEYSINGYVDHMAKVEANANANWHLSPSWNTGLLAHFENSFAAHDANHDTFMDAPKIRQTTIMDRWAYMGENYVFQFAGRFLDEKRTAGQHSHDGHALTDPYSINIATTRWEAFTKNAYIFDHENDGNVALILSGSSHAHDAYFGNKRYKANHRNIYASLMFERKWNEMHALSTGLSFNYDHLDQLTRFSHNVNIPIKASKEIEAVSGAYIQYTLDFNKTLLLMGGIRYDYSSIYHHMFTPRVHLRWNPIEALSFHASAGRGFRTPHPLAENNNLLASSRKIVIDSNLRQESAWNTGVGATAYIPISDRKLSLSAEFYHTDFQNQMLIDNETDAHTLHFKNLEGKSYSSALQVEATYPIIPDLTATAAWRHSIVKADYGQGLIQKALTSKNKWLFTASYSPMMGIWQFDATITVNGGGRMPTPYTLPDGSPSWDATYKAFPQLSAQVTRNFRNFSIYIGGENLTGFRQNAPIIAADQPFGPNFDSTLIYGPLSGAMVYAGFRFSLTKY